MTPAFGFSVGDFINAIQLIHKITRALNKTGGASLEYQYAILDLNNLSNVLGLLQKLEPSTTEDTNHVNAIRGMALACQFPLRDFLTKMEEYDRALDLFVDRTTLRTASKKVKWAVKMEDEVQKFRTVVAGKISSINLLLQIYAVKTSQYQDRERRADSERLLTLLETHAAEQRVQSDRILSRVDVLESSVRESETSSSEMKSGIFSIRNIAEQMSAYIRCFPTGLEQFLKTIIQASLTEHQQQLNIQVEIPNVLGDRQDSDIVLFDALDRKVNLSYEQFRYWEVSPAIDVPQHDTHTKLR